MSDFYMRSYAGAMRNLIFTLLLLACNTNTQVVSAECRKSYPPKASALEVVAADHKGKGLVPAGNPLEDWSLFDGEFGGSEQIHAGEQTNVRGGTDTRDPPMVSLLLPRWSPGNSGENGGGSSCLFQQVFVERSNFWINNALEFFQ